MNKDEVAETLESIAVLLELKGENLFKTRAYTNAARTLQNLAEPLDTIIAEERLGSVSSIGESMQKRITEMVLTGRSAYFEELRAATPPGLVAMLDIPGLGPKKVKAIHDNLKIETVEALEQACKEGRLAGLKGFGEKTQISICEGIERRRSYASRHLLSDALPVGQRLLDYLRQHPDVIRCDLAGSARRFCEVVGDVDLLASSKNPAAILQDFTTQPGVIKVLALGDTKAAVLLEKGLQADLRVVSDVEFPFALAYFTGSQEHNIVMRQRAIERGLRLNEYGLFKSQVETRDPALAVVCRTEAEIFNALGLSYVPPEMREDLGEFKAAEQGPIPRLIQWTDLKGSLHNHSTWSDGRQTLREIVKSMQELGLAYWAITDHSKASVQANGLNEARIRAQIVEVNTINAELAAEGSDFRLLTGIEVDILRDGRLDLPDDLLADLDMVNASLHQSFNQSEKEITARLIQAARYPYVHSLSHLTGRLLLEREPYPVNHHEVIATCAETGTWIELNASPYRLDMDWRFWAQARDQGVKCVINCDAHRFEHAGFLRLGAGIAAKAGLTREAVVNTLPLAELQVALKVKRKKFRVG